MYFLHGNHDHRGPWNQVRGDDILMTRTCGERGSGFAAIRHNFAVRQGDIALIGLETGEDKPDWRSVLRRLRGNNGDAPLWPPNAR